MATFVFCHGAWTAAWSFRKMRPLMAQAGHETWIPSYTGLGERAHLAQPNVTLDTHIADVVGVIEAEELTDVILVGFSYGGMVATGVADRTPERLRRLVYVDGFAPRDGQSLLDLVQPQGTPSVRRSAEELDLNWKAPARPPPDDTSPQDIEWIDRHSGFQPLRTMATPVRLTRGEFAGPRSYVLCARKASNDAFSQFAARAQAEGWDYEEIDSSHNPHITEPHMLLRVLNRVAEL